MTAYYPYVILKAMEKVFTERRKFIRLEVPIEMTYVLSQGDTIYKAVSNNISAEGLRFQSEEGSIKETDLLDIALNLPKAPNPVHMRAKVVWRKRSSLENEAPFYVGVEFVDIDEDNKNTFLKYLCDLIYSWPVKKEEK